MASAAEVSTSPHTRLRECECHVQASDTRTSSPSKGSTVEVSQSVVEVQTTPALWSFSLGEFGSSASRLAPASSHEAVWLCASRENLRG